MKAVFDALMYEQNGGRLLLTILARIFRASKVFFYFGSTLKFVPRRPMDKDGTKLLPEPMLTDHQKGYLVLTEDQVCRQS